MSLNELVGIYLISVSFGYLVNKVLLHCCVADKMHFSVRELIYFRLLISKSVFNAHSTYVQHVFVHRPQNISMFT